MKVLGEFTISGEKQFRFQVGDRFVTAYRKKKGFVFSCTCGKTYMGGPTSLACKDVREVLDYLNKLGVQVE